MSRMAIFDVPLAELRTRVEEALAADDLPDRLAAVPNLLIRTPDGVVRILRRPVPLPHGRPDRRGFPLDAYRDMGGMANVYKAVVSAPGGPVPEGTVVAVKVLRQELMHDADLVRRFKNESKAISLLNHPNIVKVYDVSVSENLQYIVMECVEGMTLREYLNERGGKITSRETVHFIGQILRALDQIGRAHV